MVVGVYTTFHTMKDTEVEEDQRNKTLGLLITFKGCCRGLDHIQAHCHSCTAHKAI